MADKSHHILKCFPSKSETIGFLMNENPEFRVLCDDYGDCIHARHFWGQSTASEAETRVNEYRSLVEELEKEILEALAAADSIK